MYCPPLRSHSPERTRLTEKISQLPEHYFRHCHQHKGANSATLLNYPPLPAGYQLDEQDIRAGAHKDWGSVTLLFQQDGGQPGLEVYLPERSQTQIGVQLMSDIDLENGIAMHHVHINLSPTDLKVQANGMPPQSFQVQYL
jgi:isopenicillin N synthase-like dioxygenase